MIRRPFPDLQNLISSNANERFWSPSRVKKFARRKLKRVRQFIMRFAFNIRRLANSIGSFKMSQEEARGTAGHHTPSDGGTPSPDQRERVRRSIEGIQAMKLKLERQLLKMLGERRGQDLLRDHVRRWDILMVATDEDQDFAYESRDAITDVLKGVSIAGPWEIKLGERCLGRWERMLSCSSVVVILVSNAFLKDNLLKHVCAEIMTMSTKKKVIPIYLEQMKSREFPEDLRTLLLYYGIDAQHQRPADIIKPLVRCLPKSMAFQRNLDEIDNIRKLMLRISLQPENFL